MCPDENDLVAMLEHRLDAVRIQQLEVHFDGCARCFELVGQLAGTRPLARGTPDAWAQRALAVPLDAPLPAGTIAGRYEVRSYLGGGGMGAVYLARDTSLDREVALKLHRAGSGDHRLHREAIALAKLAHPNVVTVFEVGSVDDRLFVAMEYVRGGTLRAWIDRPSARPWREVIAMLVEVGAGLAAAHKAGLVHRDFKPENVLVGDDGRPRVGDFGLVRMAGRDATDLASISVPLLPVPDTSVLETWSDADAVAAATADGSVIGTPAYMAPEQHVGEGVDARCDQFAFCVVAWECLYGERPFGGKSVESIRASIAARELVRPQGRDVPDRVRRVLERGLATDPDERYADMPELLADLRRAAAPRGRRRAAFAAVAFVGVTAAAIPIATAVRDHREAAACDAGADDVRAVFGPDRRAALERAFVESGAPDARAAYARTASILDRQVEGLARETRAACRGRAEPQPVAAARKACLAQGTRQLATLIDSLSKPAPGLALRAPDRAWSIYEPTPCAEPRPLVGAGLAAADLDRVARARGLVNAGDYDAAAAAGTALADEAHRRGDRAFELEATMIVAHAQVGRDDADAGVPALHRAQALAEALGRDFDAGSMLSELAGLAGLTQHDYTAAHRYLELARAKLERMGGGNLVARAALIATEAQILADENRLAEAAPVIARAIPAMEEAYGIEHPQLGATLGIASQIALHLEQPTEALAYGERALAMLGATLGPDHPTAAGARMTLASALIDLGRHAEAREHLRAADAVFAKTLGAGHPARAACAGNLGALELAVGDAEAALVAFRSAVAIMEKTEGPRSPGTAGARRDVSRALAAAGRTAEAAAELTAVIEILEGLGDTAIARLRNALIDLAEVRMARGEDAVEPAKRAVALATKHAATSTPTELADTRAVLARAEAARAKQR